MHVTSLLPDVRPDDYYAERRDLIARYDELKEREKARVEELERLERLAGSNRREERQILAEMDLLERRYQEFLAAEVEYLSSQNEISQARRKLISNG